jgi:hypothetical protein
MPNREDTRGWFGEIAGYVKMRKGRGKKEKAMCGKK